MFDFKRIAGRGLRDDKGGSKYLCAAALLGLVLSAGLLLSACGGGDSTQSPDDGDSLATEIQNAFDNPDDGDPGDGSGGGDNGGDDGNSGGSNGDSGGGGGDSGGSNGGSGGGDNGEDSNGGDTGGGEEIDPDATLSGFYANLYGTYSKQEGILDDNEVTVGEVDCLDPVFTSTQSLPQRNLSARTPELVTSENSYWECEGSNERYHADGTLSGSFTGDYQDVLEFWKVCQVGARPPDVSGVWNLTNLATEAVNILCRRFDIMPGIAFCSNVSQITDSQYTTTGYLYVIHGGELADTLGEENEVACYLREQ